MQSIAFCSVTSFFFQECIPHPSNIVTGMMARVDTKKFNTAGDETLQSQEQLQKLSI
jgi:hypothetical protein